jgi:hypothetical protein
MQQLFTRAEQYFCSLVHLVLRFGPISPLYRISNRGKHAWAEAVVAVRAKDNMFVLFSAGNLKELSDIYGGFHDAA